MPADARSFLPPLLGAALSIVLASCAGRPLPEERQARDALIPVAPAMGSAATLPALESGSRLTEFMRHALIASPRVQAAFAEWRAAVEGITVARSPEDPRVRLGMEIATRLDELMPGVMQEVPFPGKLENAGQVAAHESEAAHQAFVTELLMAAESLTSAYYRLHFLAESIAVQREALALLLDLERLTEEKSAAGLAALPDVLRVQLQRDELETRLATLEDSGTVIRAEWKAALGLGPEDADPPIPARFELSTGTHDAAALLATALERQPELARLEAQVLRAQSMLDLARRSALPDFEFGVEGNVIEPLFIRPGVAMTLPIWRDKIAAEIAGAQAMHDARVADLEAGKIRLATELAMELYAYRTSVRDLTLIETKLLPKSEQLLEASRSSYIAGTSSFLEVIDAQRSLLDYELARVEARTQRELSLARLRLVIAGIVPDEAPLAGGG